MHSKCYLIIVDKLEMTLEEFIIKDGDVFMVEMRFGDKWPRNQLEGVP